MGLALIMAASTDMWEWVLALILTAPTGSTCLEFL